MTFESITIKQNWLGTYLSLDPFPTWEGEAARRTVMSRPVEKAVLFFQAVCVGLDVLRSYVVVDTDDALDGGGGADAVLGEG